MKTVRLLAALVFVSALNAESSKSDKTDKTADELWADIAGREAPAASNDVKKSAPNEREARATRQADRLRGKAALAKTFYTQFPDHPKAREARKVEAVFALRSVAVGDSAQENAAYAVAKAFREDKTNNVSDRFEIALAMDRLALSSRIKGRQAENRSGEWVKLADNLQTEFGPLPELDRYYLEIAQGANMETSRSIATALLSRDTAPGVKEQAQAILERHALVGKPVNLTLTSVDGSTVELGHPIRPGVLLVIWSPTDMDGTDAMRRYRDSIGSFPCIFLAVDATANEARSVANLLPGVRAYASPGAATRSVRDALRIERHPYAYTIDANGLLAGFGPLTELPALVANLTAPAN